MPIARFSAELRRAVGDVGHLLWFRSRTVRRPRLARLALGLIAAAALGAAVVPALLPVQESVRADLADLVAPLLSAVLAVAVASAVAGGGGRELLARDPASVHPISPVTDHLGALLLAPLNAAWLIQACGLLGLVAVVVDGPRLVVAQLVVAAWLLLATALGQAVAWAAEWLRRGPRGVLLVRSLLGCVLVAGAVAGATPGLRGVLTAGPARRVAVVLGAADGPPAGVGRTLLTVLALLAATGVTVVLGGWAACLAARRAPRDEERLESRTYPARATPRSDLAMLTRVDRAAVWRSVPLRRGTYLLAIAPGAVALAGGLGWDLLVVMPGLVASGCVLLFGVNMWALDGRGALWRESLPVSPRRVLLARTRVLVELLLGAGATTLVLGAVRAGAPTPAEVVGALAALVVVVAQATSAALRWSLAAPYAVDLRSARATPAPPLAMVGYAVRLALATTLTTMLVGGFAGVDRIDLVLVATAVLLAVSGLRMWRVVRRWDDPVLRSRVVTVVAA